VGEDGGSGRQRWKKGVEGEGACARLGPQVGPGRLAGLRGREEDASREQVALHFSFFFLF